MKRTLYTGILAAAVFAAASDALRAQSNVYSLNVCSFINLPMTNVHFYPNHSLLIGPESSQYGLCQSATAYPYSTTVQLDFLHRQSDSNGSQMFGYTWLADLSTHPFCMRLNPWFAASIGLPALACLWPLAFRRWKKRALPDGTTAT